MSPKGIFFLQETHSSKVTEKYGVMNLMVIYFFFTWESKFLRCFSWFLCQYQLFSEEKVGSKQW